MRVGFTALSLSFTLLLAGSAGAEVAATDARSASVALLNEATRLAAAGNALEACAKYAESYSLDAQLDALLPLADCLEQSGKLASAYAAFRDAAEVAQRTSDVRAGNADARAQRLRPRLSYLTIEVLQTHRLPALSVERDGFRLGSSGWGVPAPVDPGKHTISVSAYGYRTWETVIDVQGDGASPYVEVPLLEKSAEETAPVPPPLAAPPPAPPAPPVAAAPPAPVAPSPTRVSKPAPAAPPSARPTRLTPTHVAALAAGGVGVVSLGVGIYFLAKTSSTLSERDGICPSGKGCAPGTNAHLADLTAHAVSQQRAGIAFSAVAVAAVALGVGLWFLPKREGSSQRAACLVPIVQTSGGGLVVAGSL
jgi:serine/threonine-protein kinase